jgi:nanoRNase/pAp phosphatase (c-di-AMP/oligoRNAs hydrolase)
MLTDESVQLFKQAVSQAQSILIFVSPQVKYDPAASALALYAGLQGLGKEVALLSPISPNENLDGLSSKDAFTQQIGNKNLQISFDYQPEMVDKVSYNIDEATQKFFLIIQPKKGTQPLDPNTIEFTRTGVNADLIITIGVTNLESLDGLYQGNEQLFSDNDVVSIHAFETNYGTVKLNTLGTTGFSEVMAKLLEQLEVAITPEIATNLLAGMERASDHFRSSATTADAFETVARLLRAGGHRPTQTKGNGLHSSAPVASDEIPPVLKNKNNKQNQTSMDVPRMEGGARI